MRYILFLSIVLIFGCKGDKSSKAVELSASDLVGHWDIYHVTRNGKVTKTLENGYLLFQADNTIKSNILSDENYHIFNFDKNKINIQDLDKLNFFDVKSLENDTLVLSTKINVFEMNFFLKKK